MTIARTIGRGTIGSPLEIPGCQLWLDAADASTVTLSSGKVSQWSDKSTSGAHVSQASSDYQPTYSATQNGHSVVSFSNAGLGNANATLLRSVSSWSVFTAFKTSALTTAQNVLVIGCDYNGAARAECIYIYSGTGHPALGGRRLSADSWAEAQASAGIDAAFAVYSGIATYGGAATLYKNGTQIATNPSWLTSGLTGNDYGNVSVGGAGVWVAGPASPLSGAIAEIVVYNTALPDANRIRIEHYLRAKWGTG